MNNSTIASQLTTFNPIINDLVIAVVIFVFGLILGRILGKIVEKILKDFSLDPTIKKTTGLSWSFEKIIGGIVTYSIYFVFLIIALNYIGITSLLLNILSIAIITILTISTILTVKDSIPNLIAHRKLVRHDGVKKGDKIVINKVEGTIEEITLFEVRVSTKHGDVIFIPNALFLEEPYTRGARKRKK